VLSGHVPYANWPRALCAAGLLGIGLVAISIFRFFHFRFKYAAKLKIL
jgi:hypothetical protein